MPAFTLQIIFNKSNRSYGLCNLYEHYLLVSSGLPDFSVWTYALMPLRSERHQCPPEGNTAVMFTPEGKSFTLYVWTLDIIN